MVQYVYYILVHGVYGSISEVIKIFVNKYDGFFIHRQEENRINNEKLGY